MMSTEFWRSNCSEVFFWAHGWMSGVHSVRNGLPSTFKTSALHQSCLSWTTQDQRPAKIWIPLIKHANRRLPMKTAPLSHFGIIQKTIEVATFCAIPPQSLWSLLEIYGHYMDIRYTVIWTLYLYGYIYNMDIWWLTIKHRHVARIPILTTRPCLLWCCLRSKMQGPHAILDGSELWQLS